jgi:hypothetical protein
VRVLEEDDGSGWVKVADSDGEKGLVPATYLEDAGTSSLENSEPSQQASGIYGMSTAYISYFSLSPGKQYGLCMIINLKNQENLQ